MGIGGPTCIYVWSWTGIHAYCVHFSQMWIVKLLPFCDCYELQIPWAHYYQSFTGNVYWSCLLEWWEMWSGFIIFPKHQ